MFVSKKSIFILFIITLAVAFLLSFIIGDHVRPYLSLFKKNASIQITTFFKSPRTYLEESLQKQKSTDPISGEEDRIVETSSLPLRLSTFPISKYIPFPKEGGALVVVNSTVFVMDRLGNFYKYANNHIKPIDIPIIPARLVEKILAKNDIAQNERVAHYVAFDSFSSRLFISYTKYVNNDYSRLGVASLRIEGPDLKHQGDWEEIFESQNVPAYLHPNQAGGKLLVDGRRLLFSVGYPNSIGYDGEWKNSKWYTGSPKTNVNSQNEGSSFGKIFQYDIDKKTIRLMSTGHRNPQGLTRDNDGSIFEVEQGPQGGDEINLLIEGGNYGWPIKSHGTRYGRYNYSWEEIKKDEKNSNEYLRELIDPIFSFVPSVAVSSIEFISSFHVSWDGDFIVGSLKGQSIYRIRMGLRRNVIFSEPIWIGHRVRDIVTFKKKLVLLTDDSKLIFLNVDEALLELNKKNNGLWFEPEIQSCLVCHSFEPTTPTSLAPSLRGIIGRKIGGDNFDGYSEAFKKRVGFWDKDNLAQFIAHSTSYVPGTSMPDLDISEAMSKKIVDILSK